jgi:DNA-binding MarR family transcriptional regulator
VIIRDGDLMSSKETDIADVLTSCVSFLLAKLSQRIVRVMDESLLELKVNVRHVAVMAEIHHRGPANQKVIGEALEIDRTSMVGLVDDLEQLNFVVRVTDPEDRRAFRVTLTPEGLRVLAAAGGLIKRAESNFLNTLPQGQKDSFLSILKSLYQEGRDAKSRKII